MKKRIYALILAVSFVFCCMVLPINAERVPTLTIESKKVKIGGEVEVALSIDGNPGIAGIVAELKYDKTAMTLVSMNAKADFGGTFVGDASQGSGFSWVSAADIKTDGVFATFKFILINLSEIASILFLNLFSPSSMHLSRYDFSVLYILVNALNCVTLLRAFSLALSYLRPV